MSLYVKSISLPYHLHPHFLPMSVHTFPQSSPNLTTDTKRWDPVCTTSKRWCIYSIQVDAPRIKMLNLFLRYAHWRAWGEEQNTIIIIIILTWRNQQKRHEHLLVLLGTTNCVHSICTVSPNAHSNSGREAALSAPSPGRQRPSLEKNTHLQSTLTPAPAGSRHRAAPRTLKGPKLISFWWSI